MISMRAGFGLLFALLLATHAAAAGRLEVSQAWIRAMPPGARMLAGYAVLHNAGDASLRVIGVSSTWFRDASMHQTLDKDGVSTMRVMEYLDIGAAQSVVFEPVGRHFMLMMPKQAMSIGLSVPIVLELKDGSNVSIEFVVAQSAPVPAASR